MKDWKNIVHKFLYPPVWVMIIITIISTAALIAVFIRGLDYSPAACVVYVMAFYSLTVVSIASATIFPEYYKGIKKKVYDSKWGNRYMTDVDFNTQMSLYRSLLINILYVAANTFWSIWYHTSWFGIFAIYYIILAIMRFLLLRYVVRNKIGKKRLEELKRARLCSVILLLINLVLSGAVLMILHQNKGFMYHGILIYVMAMYTFYITIMAIVNLIKYRRYNSPIMSMTKIINFAAALVSMLSLETAMFAQFGGEMSAEGQRIIVMATGAGVSAIIVVMSIYMIEKANKEIRSKLPGNMI